MPAENKIDELLPHQLTEKADNIAYGKATKAFLSAFYLAITAGMFISLAFVLYYRHHGNRECCVGDPKVNRRACF